MLEPKMDDDGYPTEETLRVIREWPWQDGNALFDYLAAAWIYDNYRDPDVGDGTATFSTGGWSGHEDMIDAAAENRMWWTMHWHSSTRGGHYVFKRTEAK